MNYALLFTIANASVIPAWLLLIILPKSKITETVVHSFIYPVILGGFYTFMLIHSWGGDGGMDSIANLSIAFARPDIVVLGWVHYLVFDLFIGAWIGRDSKAHGINHWIVIPSLVLTLFAGPFGLLTYLLIRWFKVRKFSL